MTQPLVAAAGLVLLLLWEQVHPFFDFFRGRRRERGWHAARNLVLGLLNTAVVAFVFVGLWLAASVWAERHGFGLLHLLERRAGLPAWGHALGAVLLLDLWTYLWHRLNHVIPFLWRFHRVHHADARMDVTTASRFHLGEIFFSSLLRIPLIVVLGVHLWELLLYETVMFAVVQFHHANVALPDRFDRALRLVIVTPGMHKVHHSRWRPETDSNYSALFSFWDRLGRTFRRRDDLRSIHLGLDGYDAPEKQTLKGLLKTPLDEVTAGAEDSPSGGSSDL